LTGFNSRPYDTAKRGLDVIASSMLLVLLSPLMLATAVLVAAKLGIPIIFVQPRPGRGGEIFTLYKFRSMRPVDATLGNSSDEDRLTKFGRALRATSIDELPSLVNVLCGDMSFVGPRPLLVEYLDRYTAEQARRHEVRPGITGLAQVSGRNALNWQERFRLDVRYVDERSFALDSRIIIATMRSVLRRDGISAEGHVTMRRFGETDG
jgi:lipopolysaccharide/colanic/teichoic acid biosynthesis glycosyltransferase